MHRARLVLLSGNPHPDRQRARADRLPRRASQLEGFLYQYGIEINDASPAISEFTVRNASVAGILIAGGNAEIQHDITTSNGVGLQVADPDAYWYNPDASGVVPLPSRGALLRPKPNPCNPRTALRFRLESATYVESDVIDARGRRVRTLYAGKIVAGEHSIAWDGADDHGRAIASGTYFGRLRAGQEEPAQPTTLLR